MATPASPLLEVDNYSLTLTGSDGRLFPVLEGIGFTLGRGETMGIAGESGSGKSVLALSLLGLLPRAAIREQRGALRFDGIDLATLDEAGLQKLRGRRLAMVFQEPMTAMNPLMTLYEQVAEGVRTHFPHLREDEVRQRVERALRRAGLADPERFFESFPHQLSGGMRQRAMLGMALATEPELIVADEPTTALDAALQVQLLQELRRTVRDEGHSLVFISHDLGVIRTVADRLAVLYAGVLVEWGPVAEVLDRPLHPYARALRDAMPRLIKERQLPRPIPGHLPSPDQKPIGCVFSPRCSKAAERCRTERPGPSEPLPGRMVRCHFPESVAKPGGKA
ncbi:MAG: Oligopeptide transport ATP-binding protein OppF [Candidatus Ozemobacter sibiricus]|uniref:Oligopeptide transport ATP-binding protein OppF n=1 Tax=Candidatus Ozemobacter sibiricus TaxID=2268124 RepID=A0A367ZR86_9BACT|nr:MAG: Oligopeptide transport ATP-binding protein OppF [Candidatus Ozemobacter sibiricus]